MITVPVIAFLHRLLELVDEVEREPAEPSPSSSLENGREGGAAAVVAAV